MTLFLGLLFGAVGTVYLALAKKEGNGLFLVCGLALIIYPYFVDGVLLTIAIGIAISLIPIGRAKGWF